MKWKRNESWTNNYELKEIELIYLVHIVQKVVTATKQEMNGKVSVYNKKTMHDFYLGQGKIGTEGKTELMNGKT